MTPILIEAGDDDFEALVAGRGPRDLPPADAGWESREVLQMLQALARTVRQNFEPAAWLIVERGEVLGLCSVLAAPDAAGAVEIGYGVAPSRRGAGVGRRAVGDVVAWAVGDRRVSALTAGTAVANIPSQRVLERNGFVRTGERTDPEDGELITWAIVTSRG